MAARLKRPAGHSAAQDVFACGALHRTACLPWRHVGRGARAMPDAGTSDFWPTQPVPTCEAPYEGAEGGGAAVAVLLLQQVGARAQLGGKVVWVGVPGQVQDPRRAAVRRGGLLLLLGVAFHC